MAESRTVVIVAGELEAGAGGDVLHARTLEEALDLLEANPGAVVLATSELSDQLRAHPRSAGASIVTVDPRRELQGKLQVLEKVIDVLIHDLRTPLSAVRLGAEVVNASSAEPSLKRTGERVLRSADRMSRLLQQLLDFSRAWTGGQLPIRAAPVSLDEVVKSAVAAIPADKRPRIDVEVTGVAAVTWDQERICQALAHLISNALAHGEENGRVRVRAGDLAGDDVVIEVHNRGAIAGEARPRLYQPMGPGARFPSGVGLGLYLVERIAAAHGGRVEHASSAEEGTTFRLILPVLSRPAER